FYAPYPRPDVYLSFPRPFLDVSLTLDIKITTSTLTKTTKTTAILQTSSIS
ncbi:unnamed protein product, partial [Rotaria socialis]